jgi:O-antigen ligase
VALAAAALAGWPCWRGSVCGSRRPPRCWPRGAIALAEPPPLLAAVCGVAAAAYLVLRHTTMTGPTVAGLVGFAVAGVVATTVPAGWSWLPLLAPVAVVLIFLVLIGPFVDDERPVDASAAERPALGYE